MTAGRLPAALIARRSWIVLSALVLALGLAACGHKQPHPHFADDNNDGVYVDAGAVTYQLQISRELNQYSVEDSQYVKGLPAGMSPSLGPTQLWFGVFLWAKNQTQEPQITTDKFRISDTLGNNYYPIRLDTALNPFAWTAMKLAPLDTEPGPGTIASDGPTQGGLLLFKLNTSVYSNRPLTLWILGPDDKRLGGISLNL
jgi:hypothetical protein